MRLRVLAVLAPLVLALTACDTPAEPEPPIACASGAVSGQGSSAQTNAVNAWIKAYQIACADAAVAYTSTGSGAGVRAFIEGTGDFAGTDTPLAGTDLQRAGTRCGGPVVHLPLVIGPIALAYNVAGVGDLRLTPQTIAGIFSGTVTAWNDPAIAGDNPGTVLPATKIRTVHRSDGSGTTANFLRYLTAAAPSSWPHGSGSDWPLPGGDGLRGSHRVVAAIARTDGAIGYVESSYARVTDLPTVRVGTPDGSWAQATDEAAAQTIASAQVSDDLRLEIDYTAATAGAYPIVQVTYELVCRTKITPVTRSFLTYAAGRAGQQAAEQAGYAPLPPALQTQVTQAIATLG
ncbi:phosphate ABC transporter substrate-binding protein PstS [Actinoplanes xinjiangensis]|uniref:Phosphate-binding protein n=1 Tax=Actinoplanes xinjiangensis TaxID=512350 RepID=A0A316FVZ4_9ACTN|nr:phosphate ABC transporter substrate-binding protein PstS [Actinoplanes xinjiangensis]PWK52583.1 phosphate ABC transporter substrate-binding protein (PhoT family) [Actinoplanes xinjiangensis]GIF36718.1 phosphate-binding protein PstS [Actinoplanes xinjiangensis]